jgi:hypothetical protein
VVADLGVLLTREFVGEPAYQMSQHVSTVAVEQLLRAAPQKFPPGAELTHGIYNRGGYPTLSFIVRLQMRSGGNRHAIPKQ